MNVSSFQGEITKKLRMLATERLKYFFSLSPSSKHAAEKGKKKTIEEKDQISASTLF
jgi:hypothetical protein